MNLNYIIMNSMYRLLIEFERFKNMIYYFIIYLSLTISIWDI